MKKVHLGYLFISVVKYFSISTSYRYIMMMMMMMMMMIIIMIIIIGNLYIANTIKIDNGKILSLHNKIRSSIMLLTKLNPDFCHK